MSKINADNRAFLQALRSMVKEVKEICIFSSHILKKWEMKLFRSLFFKLLSFPLGLSLVYITKITMDKGILGKDLQLFIRFTFLGIILLFISRYLTYLSDKTILQVRSFFSKDVNYAITKRLFGLNYLKIKELSSADNSFIADYDHNVMEQVVFYDIPRLVSIIKIPVLMVLSFMLSWQLTLLVFLTVPFITVHTIWASRIRKKYRMEEIVSSREHNSIFHDILLNLKLVKSFAKEKWALKRVSSLFDNKTQLSLRSTMFFSRSNFISQMLIKINTGIFSLLGGYLIISGKISLGTFSAVSIYALLVVSELYGISAVIQSLVGERAAICRNAAFIRELEYKDKKEDKYINIEEELFNKSIEFKGVTFSYKDNNDILKDLSLSISPGVSTLIRGGSGEGKTTLLSLLLRLFSANKGKISLGDVDIDDIDRKVFSKNISVVHQEPYLFNDTLINNILLGDEIKEADIEKAVECVNLGKLADKLPLGYNSSVGEGGHIFSGGEKQRVAIARALARTPSILIMDEATSFIDRNMEEEIFGKIKKNYPLMTLIFVTHRESTRKFADHVFTLENGKILKEICAY